MNFWHEFLGFFFFFNYTLTVEFQRSLALVNISKEMWLEQKAGARFWSVWCFSGMFIAVAMGTAQLSTNEIRKELISSFWGKKKKNFWRFYRRPLLWWDLQGSTEGSNPIESLHGPEPRGGGLFHKPHIQESSLGKQSFCVASTWVHRQHFSGKLNNSFLKIKL